MIKLKLLLIFLSALFLFESCRKDTFTETALTNAPLQADINGTTWVPKDTLSVSLTYVAATKTKTFAFNGTAVGFQVFVSATQQNATNTPGFPLTTYTVDSTKNLSMILNANPTNTPNGYAPTGVVKQGSGTITISAVDSVKKLISGTFSFTTVKDNYDSNGNLLSVTVAEVLAGQLNNLPYTFTSK
jgi:hypothetical protein